MKKIMFNDRYGLNKAVLQGCKTMTRRIISKRDEDWFRMQYGEEYERWTRNAPFMYSEVLAVAQSYKDLGYSSDTIQRGKCVRRGDHHPENEWDNVMIGQRGDWFIDQLAGWENKMLVPASMCKYHIRITNIKVERLQDISDNDCIAEGIKCFPSDVMPDLYTFEGVPENWKTAREAFARLIDKVSGKGTWNRNPYVFAYTFELVKGTDQ
jgi:hypothetical protein